MTKQMQRIQNDAQRIASEANSLNVVASPAANSGGNLKNRLSNLQTRVDRLRRALWRAQSSREPQVVPFPSESFAAKPAAKPNEEETESSLVDRVLALLDRRCG